MTASNLPAEIWERGPTSRLTSGVRGESVTGGLQCFRTIKVEDDSNVHLRSLIRGSAPVFFVPWWLLSIVLLCGYQFDNWKLWNVTMISIKTLTVFFSRVYFNLLNVTQHFDNRLCFIGEKQFNRKWAETIVAELKIVSVLVGELAGMFQPGTAVWHSCFRTPRRVTTACSNYYMALNINSEKSPKKTKLLRITPESVGWVLDQWQIVVVWNFTGKLQWLWAGLWCRGSQWHWICSGQLFPDLKVTNLNWAFFL